MAMARSTGFHRAHTAPPDSAHFRKISRSTFLQVTSVTVFEKVDIVQLVITIDSQTRGCELSNQLKLFELSPVTHDRECVPDRS